MKDSNKSIFEKVKKIMMDDYINDYAILSNLIKPTIGIKKSTQNRISKFGGSPLLPKKFDLKKNQVEKIF